MGWKNIKEHYRIGHLVQVTEAGICIGSPYVHDLIVISHTGEVVKTGDHQYSNKDLCRYISEFNADPDKLKTLASSPDTFSKSITVFTYDGCEIIEKQCEEPGWPNVTHDGQMQYNNCFSATRSVVIEFARQEAAADVEMCEDRLCEARNTVKRYESRLNHARAVLKTLEQNYPQEH